MVQWYLIYGSKNITYVLTHRLNRDTDLAATDFSHCCDSLSCDTDLAVTDLAVTQI